MIPRSKVLDVCRLLDFDPNDVLDLHISPNSVTATKFVRDGNGNKIRGAEGGFEKMTKIHPISTEQTK